MPPAGLLTTAGSRPRLLASVRSAAEAAVAVAGGADIVDAKEPAHGALGAVALDVLRQIRDVVPASIPLSATIGDVSADDVHGIVERCEAMAASVDIVKIGLFSPGDPQALFAALARNPAAHGRRVLVMLADTPLDLSLLAHLPGAGFCGVMLDTADKSAGALLDVIDEGMIERFVFTARQARIWMGLAGALRLWHIPRVLRFSPDIVGFRGALCRDGQRGGEIDAAAIAAVRRELSGGDGCCAAE